VYAALNHFAALAARWESGKSGAWQPPALNANSTSLAAAFDGQRAATLAAAQKPMSST